MGDINDDDDIQLSVESVDRANIECTASTSAQGEDEGVQRRTFSHWSRDDNGFVDRLIQAGFYSCNIGDRVICIDCGIVCHKWIPELDDPSEFHRCISPNCPYVRMNLNPGPPSSPPPFSQTIINLNLSPTVTSSPGNLRNLNILFETEMTKPEYKEIWKRQQSFSETTHLNSASVDELARAGFFHTGEGDRVTCFYCGGSLRELSAQKKPIQEHVRHFPHCRYARSSCSEEEYQKIRRETCLQPRLFTTIGVITVKLVFLLPLDQYTGRQWLEKASNKLSETDELSLNRLLSLPDEGQLDRLVAARLDLPISQMLLKKNFPLHLLKRGWEDQLRLKGYLRTIMILYFCFGSFLEEDFLSMADLRIACVILQKQSASIRDDPDSIIVPSVRMKQIRGNSLS